MNEDPIKRLTLLVLFQAQHDHATELAVARTVSGPSPIRYKVGSRWYDMAPPPAHILPDVVAELERLAEFTGRPYPKEGLIDVPYSGVRLRWLIRIANADAEVLLTPIEQ